MDVADRRDLQGPRGRRREDRPRPDARHALDVAGRVARPHAELVAAEPQAGDVFGLRHGTATPRSRRQVNVAASFAVKENEADALWVTFAGMADSVVLGGVRSTGARARRAGSPAGW